MTYDDIVIRDNFGETNVKALPGLLWRSPDIIPYGEGQLSYDDLASKYAGPDIGMEVTSPGVNNIYIRAKNYQPSAPNAGTVSLYWAVASLLCLPAQWSGHRITTALGSSAPSFVNGSLSAQLQPDDIVVTKDPFLVRGLPEPPDHYCFVAIAQTANHAIPIPPPFGSNAAFAQWVDAHPGVAWRNFTMIPNPLPQIISTAVFGNDNSTSSYFYFRFSGRGFPTGTKIVAQSASIGMQFEGTCTLPAPDNNGNQINGFEEELPPNSFGALTITVTPPAGQAFTPGGTLATHYFQVPGTDPLDVAMSRPVAMIREQTIGRHDVSVVPLIELGAWTIAVGDA